MTKFSNIFISICKIVSFTLKNKSSWEFTENYCSWTRIWLWMMIEYIYSILQSYKDYHLFLVCWNVRIQQTGKGKNINVFNDTQFFLILFLTFWFLFLPLYFIFFWGGIFIIFAFFFNPWYQTKAKNPGNKIETTNSYFDLLMTSNDL